MELASFWGQKSEGKVWAIFFQGLRKAPGRLLAGFWVLPAIFGTHSAHRWIILPTAFVSAWHLRNVSTGFLFISPSYNDSNYAGFRAYPNSYYFNLISSTGHIYRLPVSLNILRHYSTQGNDIRSQCNKSNRYMCVSNVLI